MRKSNLVDHASLRVNLEVLVKLSAPRLLVWWIQGVEKLIPGKRRESQLKEGFLSRFHTIANIGQFHLKRQLSSLL